MPGVRKARGKGGYTFHLFYLWLPTPEFAVARVAKRVKMGGHNVPAETIRRRYTAGLMNFFNLYQPLADLWYFYDNSQGIGPVLLASEEKQAGIYAGNAVKWRHIVEEYGGSSIQREVMADRERITGALAAGVRDALRRHKQAGNPVIVCRDGEMVWLQPDQIDVWEEQA